MLLAGPLLRAKINLQKVFIKDKRSHLPAQELRYTEKVFSTGSADLTSHIFAILKMLMLELEPKYLDI